MIFKKKILIGIPSYNLQIHSGLLMSVLRETKNSQHDIKTMCTHSCFIAHSRNEIVREALKHDVDYLLFWDSDVEVLSSDFIDKMVSLSQNRRDAIVCAPYRLKMPEKKFNLVTQEDNELDYVTELPLESFEVDGAGTGLMLIPCKVFSKLTDPYFQMLATDKEFVPEDWDFCFKAKKEGVSIIVDPSIRTRHWGFFAWDSHEV